MTALRAVLVRILTTLITLFGVALIVFVVIRLAPGDPIAMMLPPGASAADIERLRALYGLDRSIAEQFFIWLGNVAQGDFGTSISIRRDVLTIVLNRLPATLELSLLALLIAVALGTLLAFLATRWRETPAATGVDVVNGIALSVPDFLWGLAL
ncbi:MAG TPA: ABC transporter permease, partial [Propylenella sp.]|nr:ABC transporter permease [Propylenella sp.]